MKNINHNQAFTLIELLVVVLIIGILTAVALPQYNKAVEKAHFVELSTFVNMLQKGTELWVLQNGGLPQQTTELFFSSNNVLDIDVAGMGTWQGDTFISHSNNVYAWSLICNEYGCSLTATIQVAGEAGPDLNFLYEDGIWDWGCGSPDQAFCNRFAAVYRH